MTDRRRYSSNSIKLDFYKFSKAEFHKWGGGKISFEDTVGGTIVTLSENIQSTKFLRLPIPELQKGCLYSISVEYRVLESSESEDTIVYLFASHHITTAIYNKVGGIYGIPLKGGKGAKGVEQQFYMTAKTVIPECLYLMLDKIKGSKFSIWLNVNIKKIPLPRFDTSKELRPMTFLSLKAQRATIVHTDKREETIVIDKGITTITVPNDIYTIKFDNSDKQYILFIDMGNVTIEKWDGTFSGLLNLIGICGLNYSKAYHYALSLFGSCRSLVKISEVDLSRINYAYGDLVFNGCYNLADVVIKGFNTFNNGKLTLNFQRMPCLSAESIDTLIENAISRPDKEAIIYLHKYAFEHNVKEETKQLALSKGIKILQINDPWADDMSPNDIQRVFEW